MKFELTAKSIVSYIEDDVCVVSFADSTDAEPEKYLILSQALFDTGDDDEDISIEYGQDGDSATGGVQSACLGARSFAMKVDGATVGVSEFQIAIACPFGDGLREHLKMIFCKSPAKLTLA